MTLFTTPNIQQCVSNNRSGTLLTENQWDLSCDSVFLGYNSLGMTFLGLSGLFLAVAGLLWRKFLGVDANAGKIASQRNRWISLAFTLALTVGVQIWIIVTDKQSIEAFLIPSGMNSVLLFFAGLNALRKDEEAPEEFTLFNGVGAFLVFLGWGFAIAGCVGIVMLIIVEFKGGAIAIGVVQTILGTLQILSLLFVAVRTLTPEGVKRMRGPPGIRIFGLAALGIILSLCIGVLILCYTVNSTENQVSWPTYLFLALMIFGALREAYGAYQVKLKNDDTGFQLQT